MGLLVKLFNDASDTDFKLAQDLVAIAIADGEISEAERKTITEICQKEGISDDTVNDWAVEAGLIEEPVDSESICTKMDLIRVLWLRNCRPEYKADALTTKIKDVSKEDTYAALWAYKKGISAIDAQKNFKPKTQLTHGDVLQTLWFINGKPVASGDITGFENLDTSSTYYPAALWAADQKLLIKDEKTNFDGSEPCRLIDALRYVYYLYHVRATFPITKAQFIAACEGVTIQAREGNYHYGDSDATPPTTDGFISCDRLVAKALWDLGYTDQTPGGFANGHEDMFPYLLDHGFVQSFDIADVGYGSIVCTSFRRLTLSLNMMRDQRPGFIPFNRFRRDGTAEISAAYLIYRMNKEK